MRVLVVDRQMFLAELLRLALEADGHTCFTATSLRGAAEILRSGPFDFVVVDLATNEPESLLWLEEALLGHSDLRGRVVVLSEKSLEPAEVRCARACGARVIRKPVTLQQLHDAVRAGT